MKTFEERYTAWIDNQLEGNALVAFEQELTRRAAGIEAEADKADMARLRSLLQDHLQAPTLTNPDFFSHQLHERIDVEMQTSSRGRQMGSRREPALFAWGFAQLVGLGAFSLFAAAALYYGMMPSHPDTPSDIASSNYASKTAPRIASNVAQPVDNAPPSVAQPANGENRPAAAVILEAQRSPTPAPIDSPDIKAHIPDQPANPTTATPLHYSKQNVNVLWLNGLDYLPSVTDASPSPAESVAAAAPSPSAAPSASASP